MPERRPPAPPRLAEIPLSLWLVGQTTPAAQRGARYAAPGTRDHPAKMRPELAARLVEQYTRPGDRVLDPLSGIGTTGVEAVRRGRRYVGIELEAEFVRAQRRNLRAARPAAGATAGAVTARVVHADARRLDPEFRAVPAGRPLPHCAVGSFDAVLTSPPYEDALPPRRPPGFEEATLEETFAARAVHGRAARQPLGAGNLSRPGFAAYAAAMRHVYAGCFAALRPGGIMAVVLQPRRYAGRFRPLHHAAARLGEELGFVLIDEVVACLARVRCGGAGEAALVPHASFWRQSAAARQRAAGFPVTLGQVEYVLVFRKPEGAASKPAAAPGTSSLRPDTTKAAVGPPLPHRRRRLGSQECG